jgi:hypothetical protein
MRAAVSFQILSLNFPGNDVENFSLNIAFAAKLIIYWPGFVPRTYSIGRPYAIPYTILTLYRHCKSGSEG